MSSSTADADRHLDDETFMSAADLRSYMTDIEMARASQAVSAMDKAQQARQDLIRQLSKPITITPEMRANMRTRVRHAAAEGHTEIMIMRFPVDLCEDRGRAINNVDPDWPDSLTGVPRQAYEIWRDHLKDAGFHLRAMIVEWPQGLPGDVGLFLAWDKGSQD
jgi:hypothetical protein